MIFGRPALPCVAAAIAYGRRRRVAVITDNGCHQIAVVMDNGCRQVAVVKDNGCCQVAVVYGCGDNDAFFFILRC